MHCRSVPKGLHTHVLQMDDCRFSDVTIATWQRSEKTIPSVPMQVEGNNNGAQQQSYLEKAMP